MFRVGLHCSMGYIHSAGGEQNVPNVITVGLAISNVYAIIVKMLTMSVM